MSASSAKSAALSSKDIDMPGASEEPTWIVLLVFCFNVVHQIEVPT